MRTQARRFLFVLALGAAFSGCAATKSWWYEETGRMTQAEAAAHGHPECAGLTMRACEKKQKEAARTAVPEGSHPGG
jgi:hypothetical protein